MDGEETKNLRKTSRSTIAKESAEILNSIVKNSSDQIFMLDRSHRYLLVNKALANILGKTPEELVGKTILEVYPFETAIRFSENIDRVFSTGKSLFIEEKMVIKGQEFDISTSLNPVRDHKGKLIAVTGIVRDITQRKKLEVQLHESERLAAIGQTAAMVGHDIRNPLQAMAGDVYLLRESLESVSDVNSKQESLESLNNLEKNIAYINKIVADLQDYSRNLLLEMSNVNLYEIVINILKTLAVPSNIECLFEIDPSIRLKSDPVIIARILTNLISNAIQAMPNGGKLSIGAYGRPDNVLIEVIDTGVGIPEEVKPKLFTPMMTTKAKGQGLGLAVVKRFVEELNGTISFESKEGKGTKFKVLLPLKPSKGL